MNNSATVSISSPWRVSSDRPGIITPVFAPGTSERQQEDFRMLLLLHGRAYFTTEDNEVMHFGVVEGKRWLSLNIEATWSGTQFGHLTIEYPGGKLVSKTVAMISHYMKKSRRRPDETLEIIPTPKRKTGRKERMRDRTKWVYRRNGELPPYESDIEPQRPETEEQKKRRELFTRLDEFATQMLAYIPADLREQAFLQTGIST